MATANNLPSGSSVLAILDRVARHVTDFGGHAVVICSNRASDVCAHTWAAWIVDKRASGRSVSLDGSFISLLSSSEHGITYATAIAFLDPGGIPPEELAAWRKTGREVLHA